MNYPDSITTIFGRAVTKTSDLVLEEIKEADENIVQLHYLFGTIQELESTLAGMQEANSTINKRFPLIWLVEDITQDRRNQNGFFASVSLRVIIAYPTSDTYTSAQREARSFAPILRPIYYNLLKAISRMGEFNMPAEFEGIGHRMTERKFWGTEAKVESKLTTFVDAIDIQDLELTIDYSNCYTNLLN